MKKIINKKNCAKIILPLIAIFILFPSFSFVSAQDANFGPTNYQTNLEYDSAPQGQDQGDYMPTNQNTNNYSFKIQNPLRSEISSIPALIYELINFAMTAGVYLAVLALIWVGFTFVLAQGNDSKITEAKKALWYVIIGIAILLGSKLIVEVIKNTLSQFNPLLFK